MSHEEHVLHQLKEMHGWMIHADKSIARIKWSLYGMLLILVGIIAALILK